MRPAADLCDDRPRLLGPEGGPQSQRLRANPPQALGLSGPQWVLIPLVGLLVNALRPIRALDSRTVRTVEPAVTFDAKGGAEAPR